ncbi:LysM peptidoglycan-binding domain-containing protein, partial [Streptomyces inusitatus]|uniref:LysM peptidoglycan-binding domain-containing protein n=1 Tax=Streptomyces inusitatus TaxID=68221 RepID=UPI00167C5B6A
MPAKGKHRRPRTSTLTRGFVAAGTGGAAIALPLTVATGAHAAERSAPVAAPAVAAAAPAPAAPAAQAAEAPAPTVYRVVAGDHLSKIADEHRVGGWQKLYEKNRAAVGDDPSLIHPGLELTLGERAEARTRGAASQDRAARPAAPAPAQAPVAAADGGGGGPAGRAGAAPPPAEEDAAPPAAAPSPPPAPPPA